MDLSSLVSTTAGNWNNIASINGVTAGLIDFSTGAATGVSLTGVGWSNFLGDDFGAFPNADWLIQPATVDDAGIRVNSTGTFTFSGLSGSAYRIEIVSARTTFQYLNTITVLGGFANRTFLGSAVVTPWNSTTDGLAAGNWLIWDNLVPVGGSITIQNVTTNTLGILTAIRVLEVSEVEAVPEPASLILLGAGLAGLGLRRRLRTTKQ